MLFSLDTEKVQSLELYWTPAEKCNTSEPLPADDDEELDEEQWVWRAVVLLLTGQVQDAVP